MSQETPKRSSHSRSRVFRIGWATAVMVTVTVFGGLIHLRKTLIENESTPTKSSQFPGFVNDRIKEMKRYAEESGIQYEAQNPEGYSHVPMSFEANEGQTDQEVQFISRGKDYRLFLTQGDAILSLQNRHESVQDVAGLDTSRLKANRKIGRAVLMRMKLIGAVSHPEARRLDELPGKVNYYIGSDPSKWRTNIATYGRIQYEDVYPGVDIVYYGNQRQLEYDFVVHPGADPSVIRLAFSGTNKLQMDHAGNLVFETNIGRIVQPKPRIFQDVNGCQNEISGNYVIDDSGQVGFNVGSYDASKPLVVDPPVLVFSSFLGGSGPEPGSLAGIAVDSSGNAYLTGETFSSNFPGTFNPVYNFDDAFVTKLNAAGNAIVYSTYVGGGFHDEGNAIAVDSSGNAYVSGDTASPDFPTTVGAYQRTLNSVSNCFVTKINSAGLISYSTFLGGNGSDKAYAVAVDSSNNAYVTGYTLSSTFPVTAGTYQATKSGDADVFVTKLNVSGSNLVYSTYLGGTDEDDGLAITVDSSGSAYITGATKSTGFPKTPGAFRTSLGSAFFFDAFVTKLNATGTNLVYSTFLGGNNDDVGYGISLDSSGNAYVAGRTSSANFPTTPGAFQTSYIFNEAFVTKLNATGSSTIYSTYLGGDGDDAARAIAVDSAGYAHVTGYTFSHNFPRLGQLSQSNQNFGNSYDAFITKLDISGASLKFSTYLGGSETDVGYGITLDSFSNAYVIGKTESNDFPRQNAVQNTAGGGSNDAFIAKIAPERTLTVTSVNPGTGVLVTATPTDNNGLGSGNTSFTRLYNHNTNVTLTAPQSVSNATFQKWQRDNVDVTTSQSINVTMDADHMMTAVYIPKIIQFSTAGYTVSEGAGFATIIVTRSGDTSGTGSVHYATSEGTAKEGKDYVSAFGVLTFAAGETSKSFQLLIIDNGYVGGSRTVNLTLSNPTGATLSTQSTAVLTITENDTLPSATNPIDASRFFTQEHYYDFLGRYPDQAGWDFWTNQITNCNTNQGCIDASRVSVSASFFLSIEFQQTGYLVERLYKAAYGDATGSSFIGGTHSLLVPVIRFSEFLPDTAQIGSGVVVLATGWETVLENNKQTFTSDFVQRSRFTTALPTTMSPAQFVDKLFQNAGVTPTVADRNAAISEFGSATTTTDTAARARALRRVGENSTFTTQEFNRAFVLMQYFGYLRRDPNSGPDNDHAGYEFWLTKLNQFNGDFIKAEMVKAFITSIEYRQRFGP